MGRPQLLVTRMLLEEAMESLRKLGSVDLWEQDEPIPRVVLRDKIKTADGMVCLLTDQIDAEVLADAPRLCALSTMAVGYDHIDIKACTERGIPVGHTPGVLTESTADLAFSLLLAAGRRVVESTDFVKAGLWESWSPTLLLGQEVHGATIGIVGFGRIGEAVARRAAGFGMRILIYHSSSIDSPRLGRYSATQVSWDTIVEKSDFLTLHVPLTQHTRHMIDGAVLQRMKPTVVLINTARGGLIDTAALYDALKAHIICAAALDVTDPEPLPPTHPLLSLSNCLVVPHIGSATITTRTKMATMAVENLSAGLRGIPMPNCVNPEVYRS